MGSVFLDTDMRYDTHESLVDEAYQTCEEITRNASTSFMRSFRYLDSARKKSVFALYAFCRRADDIVDGDWQPDVNLSHLDDKAADRAIQLSVDRQSESSYSPIEYHQRVRSLLWFHENLDAIESGEKVSLNPILHYDVLVISR